MKYKLHKCDKSKGERGKYQIMELYDEEFNAWRCVGVYFYKNDAIKYLALLRGLNNMQFSTQQIKITYNFMALADEATLQTVLMVLTTEQLKRLHKASERSLKKRIPLDHCRCTSCHMHDVNKEDGVEYCDSCLAE